MMRDRDWPRYGEMRDGLRGWTLFIRDKTRAFPLTALLLAFALGLLLGCGPAHAGAATARATARSADALERIADAMEQQNYLLRVQTCNGATATSVHRRLTRKAADCYGLWRELEETD